MTKRLFTLILFLVAGAAIAQNIEIKGVVKDIQSKEPLGYANVSTQDGLYSTISNSEGKFFLSCPQGTQKIVFTYLGYATLTVNTASLPQDGVYLMDVQEFMLDELIMLNTPMDELIDNLIKNSVAKLTSPIVLSTYYREFVSINNKFTKFSDGLIDYDFYKKDGDVKTNLVVKQSRAAEITAGVQEGSVRGIGPDVRKAVSSHCNFSVLKELFPKKKAYKNYDYIVKAIKSENGTQLQSITLTPKSDIKKALFEVSIVYNPQSNIILNIDAKMAPSHVQYAKQHNVVLARYIINDLNYKIAFKEAHGQYLLSYGYIYGSLHIWNKNYDNTYKFTSDVIVTNFTTDTSKFDKAEKYRQNSLYENGNHYTEKFWLKNNSIVLTNEEEQVIKSLQNK
jgi:hypothetical protein